MKTAVTAYLIVVAVTSLWAFVAYGIDKRRVKRVIAVCRKPACTCLPWWAAGRVLWQHSEFSAQDAEAQLPACVLDGCRAPPGASRKRGIQDVLALMRRGTR